MSRSTDGNRREPRNESESTEFEFQVEHRHGVKRLVAEVDDGLHQVATLISDTVQVPLTADGKVTRFEVKPDPESSDSGVMIIGLPTDPPLLACAYYTDGEYTKVVWPCTHVVVGDVVLDLGGVF